MIGRLFRNVTTLPQRTLSWVVAFGWVGLMMMMILIPSAVNFVFSLFAVTITSPVRVIRPTIAAWLGQACCRSRDFVDHILAVNAGRCEKASDKWLVVQTHRVVVASSADGHVLRVDRVFRSDSFGRPGFVPVLLQHGVLQSGGIFVVNGPHSVVVALADAGLDVWVANSRTCHAHETDKPGSVSWWDFTLDELGEQDVPEVVRYIREQTGRRIAYIGHSQGASSGVVAFGADPAGMREAVRIFVMLSPAILLKPQVHWFFTQVLMRHPDLFELLGGNTSFAPALYALQRVVPRTLWSIMGVWAVSYLFGWRPLDIWYPQYIGQYFLFAPAMTSARLVTNWLAMLGAGRIRKRRTLEPYSLEPLSNCPIAIIHGLADGLVEAGEPLHRELEASGCHVLFSKGIPQWGHMDVIWARSARALVFEPMIEAIRASVSAGDPDFVS